MKLRKHQNPTQTGGYTLSRAWIVPLLVVALLAGVLAWGVEQAMDPAVLPIRIVGVDGEIQHLQRSSLEATVADAVNGSFLSMDLERVRHKVEQLPWIESASVRRIWPDTLRVKVVEQVPLAYWGKDGLVSARGEVFRPENLPRLKGLATLEGEDESAVHITREYLRMRTLLETAGLELSRIRLDARQAWRLETSSGLTLNLGRREVLPRLTRFVQLYPYLKDRAGSIPVSVDLRYTNGFSVRWQSDPESRVNFESHSTGLEAARIARI